MRSSGPWMRGRHNQQLLGWSVASTPDSQISRAGHGLRVLTDRVVSLPLDSDADSEARASDAGDRIYDHGQTSSTRTCCAGGGARCRRRRWWRAKSLVRPPTHAASPVSIVITPAWAPVRVPGGDLQGWPARRRCASLEVGLLCLDLFNVFPQQPEHILPRHPWIAATALADVIATDIDGRVRAAVWGCAGTNQGELFEAGGPATAVTGVVTVITWPARHHVSLLPARGQTEC
jgi:hypothetical protein